MGSQRGVEAVDRAIMLVLRFVAVNRGSFAKILGERCGLETRRDHDGFCRRV